MTWIPICYSAAVLPIMHGALLQNRQVQRPRTASRRPIALKRQVAQLCGAEPAWAWPKPVGRGKSGASPGHSAGFRAATRSVARLQTRQSLMLALPLRSETGRQIPACHKCPESGPTANFHPFPTRRMSGGTAAKTPRPCPPLLDRYWNLPHRGLSSQSLQSKDHRLASASHHRNMASGCRRSARTLLLVRSIQPCCTSVTPGATANTKSTPAFQLPFFPNRQSCSAERPPGRGHFV